jgi:hypothetical protein
MKGNSQIILSLLAVISLVVIGIVVFRGITQNKPAKVAGITDGNILGDLINKDTPPTLPPAVKSFVQNTIQNTKETLSQKADELKKTIVADVEKQVADMTQSQIDAVKLQICRDWGVVSVSATPTKKPDSKQ